jgi:TonB family protein
MELFYVVMEYAEDDLSQLLPNRPLTPAEAREMLGAVLDAIGYVHDKGFVHGRLRPSNIMAVNGQLKVSSDGLCRLGESRAGMEKRGVYDSPELASGQVSPAGDVWSLGIMLVEVLTQHPLVWEESQEGEPAVPKTVPMPFRDFVVRSLHRDPQRRWTVADFAARLRDASPSANGQTARSQEAPSKWRFLGPALAVGLLLAGVLVAPRLLNRPPEVPQNPSTVIGQPRVPTEPGERLPTAPEFAEEANPRAGVLAPGKVVHQVLPNIPQSARDTIQGTVRVGVRVRVDETGSVTVAEIDSPGPSQYFARLASQASRLWKFTPPQVDRQDVPSEWILRFGFTRTETKVDPVQVVP